MPDLNLLIVIVPAIITLQIGIFIFLAGRSLYLNRVFLFLSLLIFLWQVEGAWIAPPPLIYPLLAAGGDFLPVTFFQFSLALVERTTFRAKTAIFVGYVWAGALALTGLSPLRILQQLAQFDSSFEVLLGILFYLLYFLPFTLSAVVLLVLKYKSTTSSEANQYLLVALGAVTAILGGIVGTLHKSQFAVLMVNGVSGLGYALTMGWAIWRYQVLRVSRRLRSGAMYSLVFSFIFLLYLILVQGISVVANQYWGWSRVWVRLVATIVVGPLFYPVRHIIDDRVRRFFPLPQDEYHDKIGEFSRELANLLPLEEIAEKILSFITAVFEIPHGELVVYAPDGTLRSWGISWSGGTYTIHDGCFTTGGVCGKSEGKPLTVTLASRETTVGLLKLGSASGEPLSRDEFNLINLFAGQAGISLQNAQLFTELSALTRHYEAVLAGSLNGVMVLDGHLRIVTINEAGAEMFGMSSQADHGRYLPELSGTQGLEWIIAQVKRTGEPVRAQETLIGAEGRQIPVAVDVSFTKFDPIQPEQEPSIIVSLSDLREKKLVEKELRRTERLAALGRLTAGLTHEFRNGLNKIGGYALMLDDLTADRPDLSHYAHGIHEDVQDLAEILNRFLMFAREKEYEPTRVSVVQLLKRIADSLKKEADMAHIELEMTFSDEPWVAGDAHNLSMAFFNLLINAVQALEEVGGGRVGLTVNQDKTDCTIVVRDNGPGIAPKMQESIFDPFYTTKETGTGLGLPITYKIIEEHHGTLRLESVPGQGSSFIVKLPLCSREISGEDGIDNEAQSSDS